MKTTNRTSSTRRRTSTITKQNHNMQNYTAMYIASVFIAAIVSISVIYLLISLNLGAKKSEEPEQQPEKTVYYYRLEEDDNGNKYFVIDKTINYYNTNNDSSYSINEYEDNESVNEFINSYYEPVNEFTDLATYANVSVDQMEILISRYTKNHSDSLFIGSAESFIKASKSTGLNPVFLFALAGQESGWKVSDIHRRKNNPYSINMIDSNINAGLTLGDTFNEGIINGAKWIKDHYYDNGQTSIYLMQYGNKRYASDDNWMSAIISIMNNCYRILNDNL